MPRNDQVTRQWYVLRLIARIIHECRREAAETEARRGFSQVRATQAYLRSVEETEREKPRRARGSAAVVGVHEYSGLESSRGLTLDELMQELPADYPRHPRTLRRDVGALEMAGFPLVNERVDGRVRWRLMDGFRKVPALNFSPTELMALLLGRHLLKPLEGTHIHSALDSVLSKAAAVLPAASHDYVHQLQGVFTVGIGPHKIYRQHRDSIDRLTQAIAQAKTVQLRYFSASRGRLSRREIDPYRLWYASGGLYLVAYCHLRRDVRMFAVERIQSVTLTDHPYQMPLGFDLEAYVQDALTVMRGPRIEVELLFNKETAAWVRDRIWHPSQRLTQLKDGKLRMTLAIADSRELVGWVLSFGSGVNVIRPGSLRIAVEKEARRIVNMNGDTGMARNHDGEARQS